MLRNLGLENNFINHTEILSCNKLKKKMMKRFLFVFFILQAIVLWSCDDQDDRNIAEIAPVSNVTYETGSGEILFKWVNPEGVDITYVEISYEDSEGVLRRVLVEGGETEKLIEGFGDSNLYEFLFVVYAQSGASSLPVSVTVPAQPEEPNLNIFNARLQFTRQSGGLLVSWLNDFDSEFYVQVTYYDVNNNEHTSEIVVTDPGEGSELVMLDGVMETTLYISTSDKYGNFTIPREYAYKILESGRLDPTVWTLTASSVEQNDGGPYIVENLIDRDATTFWHSDYTTNPQQFPHYIDIDLKRRVQVEQIGLRHRQRTPVQANGIVFYGRNTLTGTYTQFYEGNMNSSDMNMQYFTLSSPVVYRYLRIELTTPPSGVSDQNASLSELEIWGTDIDE